MKEVEKMLYEEKLEIDKIRAPEELELRLKAALENKGMKNPKKRTWRLRAVAVIMAILLIGYNFDTLAFYTKRLIGYDGVMNGTLKQLNELGKGQVIEKSYTFGNGVKVTLDGIMLDDNRLIAFYTVKDTHGKIDSMDFSNGYFKGMKEYRMHGSQGLISDDETEVHYISDFATPKFFEKQLEFRFGIWEKNEREEGSIKFSLDRSKAMGHTLKKSINKSVKVDESKIRFKSISASPTGTSIKGYIQNIIELAKEQIKGEGFRHDNLEIQLIANGKEVASQGSSMSTDMKGTKFQFDYDALPTDLEKLQIKLVSSSSDHDADQKVYLNKDFDDKSINVLGQRVEFNNIYESNGDTYITITTDESTILTRVYLIMDGKAVELKETINDDHIKINNAAIKHTRTMHFPGKGEKMELDIQRITYKKVYNKVIDIDID
jgi:hypothetical protein